MKMNLNFLRSLFLKIGVTWLKSNPAVAAVSHSTCLHFFLVGNVALS